MSRYSFVRYAESFLGVPYIYGGNNRLAGLDCSGFICEVLRSVGLVGNFEDLNAQLLYERFKQYELLPMPSQIPSLSLMFYGVSLSQIEHVALTINPYTLIEAGGGRRTTVSFDEAKRVGACVRERFIYSRRDHLAVVTPPYPWKKTSNVSSSNT